MDQCSERIGAIAAALARAHAKASAPFSAAYWPMEGKVIRVTLAEAASCSFAVDCRPQLMTARHLYAKPTIGDARPELDLRSEIVEHEIAALGADEQHQMMLSGTDDDLAQ